MEDEEEYEESYEELTPEEENQLKQEAEIDPVDVAKKNGYTMKSTKRNKKGELVYIDPPKRETVRIYKRDEELLEYDDIVVETTGNPFNPQYESKHREVESEATTLKSNIILGIERMFIKTIWSVIKARGITISPEDFEDIAQECFAAATRKLKFYDPYNASGAKFQSYIRQDLKSAITGYLSKYKSGASKHYCQNISAIRKKEAEYIDAHGHAPSISDLQSLTALSRTTINNAKTTEMGLQKVSFEDSVDQGSKEEANTWAVEADVISKVENTEIGQVLKSVAGEILSDIEIFVLSNTGFRKYYEGELSDREIAAILSEETGEKYTKPKVQCIKNNAARKLRTNPVLKEMFNAMYHPDNDGQKMLAAEPINFLDIDTLTEE